MARIDLNADVGEGAGQDPELMPLLTSANIACGVHAGDPGTMRATVALANEHRVAIGAHPSFPDREGFGRRPMDLPPTEVERCVRDQLRSLTDVATAAGTAVQHVKAHGALYNMAAVDPALADAIARAMVSVDPTLILVGLAGSQQIGAGRRAGLRTASEVFADRAYLADGTLAPRSLPGSVIDDADAVAARAVAMVRDGYVVAIDGTRVLVQADTICLHGDTPGAATLARRVRSALEHAGVEVAPIGKWLRARV